MKGSILSGLHSGNTTIPEISPSCPGGNCTWPLYKTLGVCASVADVGSHLTFRDASTDTSNSSNSPRWYLTPHHFIIDGYPQMNVSSAAVDTTTQRGHVIWERPDFNNSIAFADVDSPLLDAFLIVKNGTDRANGNTNTYTAYELLLQWCVKEFNTSVFDGAAMTELVSSYKNFTLEDDSDLTASPTTDPNLVFTVERSLHESLQRYFTGIFNGTATQGHDGYWYASSGVMPLLFEPFNVFQIHMTDRVWDMSNGIIGTNQTGLELIMQNVATGMTN